MDGDLFDDPVKDTLIPPPPGVDIDEHRLRHQYEKSPQFSSICVGDRDYREYETRSLLDEDRDYRDFESRRDRSRDSRHNKDDPQRSRHSGKRKDSDSWHERRAFRDRSRDCERQKHRDAKRERDYRADEIPHSTILVKGMEPHISEEDIRNEIIRYSLFPKDVTLIRKRSSGESRGFAYVEFQLLSDAVRWKELTQGVLFFGSVRATLHYYVPASDRPLLKTDWTCIVCGVNNFRKREACFKCNAPKEEAELINLGGEGCEEVSHSASSTLLFRNLDILTTEERVLSMLGQITVLPIKNLKVAKDDFTLTSRGFAYVELHSISEATQLHDLLLSMAGNFYVDGRRVTVTYSRRSLSSMNCAASANAASAALAAAQWTNQNSGSSSMFSDSAIQRQQAEGVLSSNAEIYQQYSTPDISTYQYDKASGYYYDSVTGFYYDPNSSYYYDSQNRQYLYWDAEKNTYLSVPAQSSEVQSSSSTLETPSIESEQKAVISSPPVTISHAPVITGKKDAEKLKGKGPMDRVKIAKKVAKDMEKWAKTLNQKKEKQNCGPSHVPETPSLKGEKHPEVYKEKNVKDGKSIISLAGLQAYGEGSDSEAETEPNDEGVQALNVIKAEESRLIDWSKLACLLCKRQFPAKEVLNKHVQLSDLHRQNVNMLKLTKLSPKQLQELEKKESGYRDRAKERREKFGQPNIPPPNKLKTKFMKERKEAVTAKEELAEPIGSDNIGNKMLKAMGWTEGQGLGKSGQGMSGIIEVQRRVKSAGLGMKGASYGANTSDSYKDAVRKAMQARYNDIA